MLIMSAIQDAHDRLTRSVRCGCVPVQTTRRNASVSPPGHKTGLCLHKSSIHGGDTEVNARSKHGPRCAQIAFRVDGHPIESATPLFQHGTNANARIFLLKTGAKLETMGIHVDEKLKVDFMEGATGFEDLGQRVQAGVGRVMNTF